MKQLFVILGLTLMAACGRGVPDAARVVVAGDSVLAWNRIEGASVADGLRARLGEPVGDVSLPLAQVAGGRGALNIPTQLEGVQADWIVLNGGANDLGVGCGRDDTAAVLDRLISSDGARGAIPALVADLRGRGSRVIWADYYTSPRYAGTPCAASYQVLETRLTVMAARDDGVTLVDMEDVIAPSELNMFDTDRTHPSPAGSDRIAGLIARALPPR
ncbi:SGNH/GDSL hydrolase family protein [Sagittula sp. NFXS13]|uniref:SGNH/GDSL hydrolase family protein n=1 Tax=Sagittula sp. NFXS13 TaxID=2819095 RepID=UPI0032DF2A8F